MNNIQIIRQNYTTFRGVALDRLTKSGPKGGKLVWYRSVFAREHNGLWVNTKDEAAKVAPGYVAEDPKRSYIVRELQNPNDQRLGTTIKASSLAHAKRRAPRLRAFAGTILVIDAPNGARLSIQPVPGGKWEDCF